MTKHFFLLAALATLLLSCGGSAPPADVRVGQPLPDFDLKTVDGKPFSNKDLGKGPAIINFWATWCQPCRKELPSLVELHKLGKAQVVGIALDEGGANPVTRFAKKHDIGYTLLLGNQEIFRRFQGFAIPYTLVVDGSGTIINIHRSPASMEDLLKDLEQIQVAKNNPQH